MLAGDFRQLEPVRKEPIYKTDCPEMDWVNCFIELNGMHRFKDDLQWGKLLGKFRNGEITQQDICSINDRCLVKKGDELPDGIQYASYTNRTRDVINTIHFEKYCEEINSDNIAQDAIMIFSDQLMRKSSSKIYVPIRSRKTFYEKVGENDIRPHQQKPRLDPVLKLFRNCPVMLTHNQDVEEKRANGTCTTLEQVVFHPGETTFTVELDSGVSVRGVFASQVDRLILRHQHKDMRQVLFHVKPEEYTVDADWPIPKSLQTGSATERLPMKMFQIPVVRNTATTGHKLQGKTVKSIFVYEWHYGLNWPYVVLSRVTTMDGVYIRNELDSMDMTKYAVPIELVTFMEKMREYEPNEYPNAAMYQQAIN